MRKVLEKSVDALKFLKLFLPFLALVYLLIWCIGVYSLTSSFYIFINKIFGFFPNLFNKFLYIEADLCGQSVPMGYVYIACIIIILMYIDIKILDIVSGRLEIIKEEENEREKQLILRKQAKILRSKENKPKEDPKLKIKSFYGLMEFQFTPIDKKIAYNRDLSELKKEYSKLLVEKMQRKYPSIQFASLDKIFILSRNFYAFSELVKDLLSLYRVFLKLNYKYCIQTDLILSFYSTDIEISSKYALRILTKMNSLNYKNKIIVSDKFYTRYQEDDIKHFEFVPLGTSRLMALNEKDVDIDMDIYYLKNMK